MKFTVHMTCDNAAFDPDAATEVARILHGVADRIARDGGSDDSWKTIYDLNGNDVGRYKLGDSLT